MTEVCIVGAPEVELRYELLSRETARDALATYDLTAPYENTLALRTVSLGAAVALCNDLNWYLVRFAAAAFVREPAIHPDEWFSRDLATAVRDERVDPEETGRHLALYGVLDGALTEPQYVVRTHETPDYETGDSETIDEAIVVRVTEDEFEA